jgi:hypothetical protein
LEVPAIREGNAEFRKCMKHAPGTLIQIWGTGSDGAGYMGVWLVGQRTLWKISQFIKGDLPVKSDHPSKLYDGINRHEVYGQFLGLNKTTRDQIVVMLRSKKAEGNKLFHYLNRMTRECSSLT